MKLAVAAKPAVIALLALLAAVTIGTRRVDWYGLTSSRPA
jgi:inner membrane protein involved in colicin E2 resistance